MNKYDNLSEEQAEEVLRELKLKHPHLRKKQKRIATPKQPEQSVGVAQRHLKRKQF